MRACALRARAVVQFGIRKVVVGESVAFAGARGFMQSHGVGVFDLNLDEYIRMMEEFVQRNPRCGTKTSGYCKRCLRQGV